MTNPAAGGFIYAKGARPRVYPAVVWARVALLLLFGLWGLRPIWMDHRTGKIGSSFLHGPLLVFHKAGHVFFRLFGEFVTILGGTLGQLLMSAHPVRRNAGQESRPVRRGHRWSGMGP